MIIAEDIQTLPVTQVINNTLDYARRENISVAVWKHPEEQKIQLIIDFSPELQHNNDPLECKVPGFIFAPHKATNLTFLIKPDLHIDLLHDDVNCTTSNNASKKTDAFFEYLKTAKDHSTAPVKLSVADNNDANFKELVRLSVKSIRSGAFQKVVPSRKKEITLDRPLDLGENFIRLTEKYPAAFISLVFVPQAGVWMGATPELLISVKGNLFKTVSLAGTQKYEADTSLANVAWTHKEIEEQALVSRYIINCFKKIRLREYEEIGPRTVVAGNLLHLKTEFRVDMEATGFPDLGDIMLKLLHPTSAICGMPLEPARRFLEEQENYDRKYFSGFLGPANFNGVTELYVNLRCMYIEDKKATLFAGAGVTEDSQPEKEWKETEIKMNTLLKTIR